MKKKINLAIVGGLGKAGNAVLKAFLSDENFKIVTVVDPMVLDLSSEQSLFYEGKGIELRETISLSAFKSSNIDYFVDFTTATTAYENSLQYIQLGKRFIMCTSGLNLGQKQEIERQCIERNIHGAIIPNASTHSALTMHACKTMAKFSDCIILTETHDRTKLDAPSGTAYNIMVECLKAKGYSDFSAEQFEFSGTGFKDSQFIKHKESGIEIHAKRPVTKGVATQVVEFHSNGTQLLKIEHVAYNRECYKEGVAIVAQYLSKNGGFIQGLEIAMGLA